MRQQSRAELEALGRPADSHVSAEQWSQSLKRVAEAVTGHDDQNVPDGVQALFEARFRVKVVREFNSREITLIDAFFGDLFQMRGVDVPEIDDTAAVGELQRQRRAPGTGTDNCDWLIFVGAVQLPPPLPPPFPAPFAASAARCCWLCA